MATERQKRIARALTALAPRVPFRDAEAIRTAARSAHMRRLAPESAVWLAAIARIRHEYTDYDALMDEGYDKDSARFFVLDAANEVLDGWGATRRLDPDAGDTASGTTPTGDGVAAARIAEREMDVDGMEDEAEDGNAHDRSASPRPSGAEPDAAKTDRRAQRSSARHRRAHE